MYLYFTNQEQVGLLPDFSFPTDITTRSLANTLHLAQPVSAQPLPYWAFNLSGTSGSQRR
jgi:hypothetical protein